MKSKVDKLNVDKLVPTPVDLLKLSDAVKYDAVRTTEYDKVVKKVNAIQTTDTNSLVKKKMTITQESMKLKRKLLTMIIVKSVLLRKNLIS